MATLVADAFRAAFGRQTLSQTTVAQALASLFGWRGDTPELETSESGQASMGGPPGGGPPGAPADTGPGVGPGDTTGDFARGGLVSNLHPGPGDDELAIVSGGEFVLSRPAVKRLGLARL